MAAGISARLTPSEGRRFALTVGGAFLALAGVSWWRGRAHAAAGMAVLGLVLLVSGLAFPSRLGPVQRAWMGLGHAVSRITAPVFLGIVYFLVLTPVGAVMRLAGRRTLVRPAKDGSWWVARGGEARARQDMERSF